MLIFFHQKEKLLIEKEKLMIFILVQKDLARELDIPIWSVSQVNRAGAKDDIIEGDKAAGSYDKIMIQMFVFLFLNKKRR